MKNPAGCVRRAIQQEWNWPGLKAARERGTPSEVRDLIQNIFVQQKRVFGISAGLILNEVTVEQTQHVDFSSLPSDLYSTQATLSALSFSDQKCYLEWLKSQPDLPQSDRLANQKADEMTARLNLAATQTDREASLTLAALTGDLYSF